MKVAMISDWYPPKLGGVETLVEEMAENMNNRPEAKVDVITQNFSSTFTFRDKLEENNGVTVKRLAGITGPFHNTYFHPELPFKIKELFKEEDYDVVHTHHFFTPLSVLSTKVAREMYPPRECIVSTNHTYHEKSDSILFTIPKFFASLAGKSSDRILAGSQAAAKIAREICDPDKVRIIRYGVPIDSFNPEKKSQELRERLGVDSDSMIMYAGRFGKRKGVEYLIKAFNSSLDKLDGSKLVLIGKGSKEKTYRKIIDDLNLKDDVIIEGFKPKEELEKFYATADFAVFPSVRDESFGRVLTEAMASGTPYIATEIPGFEEVFEDGTGFILPPTDVKALSEKIVELGTNSELRERFGENGRKVAVDKYSWDEIVDEILGVYNEVFSEV
ncbi:hypothetical protein AKJ52_02990 [candidate division MSBL1 archaeon SCGC-AAA382C18]|uniref:Glycosyl transferase family 1 n=1 Tax=candidate division MSBL1 archaeon SCGC-AAA382C18 TaxID=1698281 RepID=A0A133VHA2_9EURY|nr:hypothetical protein AKJ52_02990 [candidate division MSBL1 archaeon SCGC-AAA382C18]